MGKDVQKFQLFDIDGSAVGFDFRKRKNRIHFIISFFLFAGIMLLPLDSISDTAARTLALTALVLYMWITLYVDLMTSSLVLAGGAILLGLLSYKEVATLFGSSQFLPMLGICIVALGASTTKLTSRFAYFLLWKFGRKPRTIALVAVIVCAVLSSVVSNIATAILLAATFAPVIEHLGNKQLGKAIMILLPVSAMYGGAALINGSGPNLVALQNLELATEGTATVSYLQWATVGWVSLLLIIPIIVVLYTRYFKVPKTIDGIDVTVFKQSLNELGPITGKEIRWLLIMLTMIVFLVFGFPMGYVGVIFGTICLLPGIGIVSGKEMLKNVPWFLLFILGFSPVLSSILTQSKLTNVLISATSPYLNQFSILGLILFFTFLKSILNNIIISGPAPVSIILISSFAPVVMSLGYNPVAIFMPALILSHPATILGSSASYQTTYQYGYWDITETIRPGAAMMLLGPIVVSVVCYLLYPLLGISLML
ncbi:anion permease [Fusibacter paucivorans]|uniref:Anion permease n=1 Tax=Fusibacter paucivorans TaxID=76009 RepID=A0ABS5PQK5_9FIRM|nr:SLC13 family permease [Fusibacter paucivorans]MBS7527444.1 anion permease [Fusibacter paucivorans]